MPLKAISYGLYGIDLINVNFSTTYVSHSQIGIRHAAQAVKLKNDCYSQFGIRHTFIDKPTNSCNPIASLAFVSRIGKLTNKYMQPFSFNYKDILNCITSI